MDKKEQEEKDRSLADKAISIEGNSYTTVHERIKYFNSKYPEGGIETQILSQIDSTRKIVKALVTPDWKNNPQRRFTGHSEAFYNEKDKYMSAALEIAETSAIGRALGSMAIGIIGGMASADEIKKNSGKKPTAENIQEAEIEKVDYNVIPDEAERSEALEISTVITSAQSVEELKDLRNRIKESGLAKEAIDVLKADYNRRMKYLKSKQE